MGFFSKIFKSIKKIASPILKIGASILGFGVAEKAIGSIGGAVAKPAAASLLRRTLPVAGAALAGAAVGGLAGSLGGPEGGVPIINPATGQVVGAGGGNGRFNVITTVTTIDNVTGQAVRQKVFAGAPFIMQKEVAHMRSVAKKLSRAHGRVPTRKVKQGINSMISDAIKDKILHSAQIGASAAMA